MTRMPWLRLVTKIIYRAWWFAFDDAIAELARGRGTVGIREPLIDTGLKFFDGSTS